MTNYQNITVNETATVEGEVVEDIREDKANLSSSAVATTFWGRKTWKFDQKKQNTAVKKLNDISNEEQHKIINLWDEQHGLVVRYGDNLAQGLL